MLDDKPDASSHPQPAWPQMLIASDRPHSLNMSQCNERSKQTASAIKHKRACARRISDSSSGDVVLSCIKSKLQETSSTVRGTKGNHVKGGKEMKPSHKPYMVLTVPRLHTGALDIHSFPHRRILKGWPCVRCVCVCVSQQFSITLLINVIVKYCIYC